MAPMVFQIWSRSGWYRPGRPHVIRTYQWTGGGNGRSHGRIVLGFILASFGLAGIMNGGEVDLERRDRANSVRFSAVDGHIVRREVVKERLPEEAGGHGESGPVAGRTAASRPAEEYRTEVVWTSPEDTDGVLGAGIANLSNLADLVYDVRFRYYGKLRYVYGVDGRVFKNDDIWLHVKHIDLSSTNRSEFNRLFLAESRSDVVPVFVDQQFPQRSCLVKGPHPQDGPAKFRALDVGMLLGGLALLASGARHRR